MPKKVPYLDEQRIERDAAALLAEYQQARGVVITRQVPIEDIVEKHLKLGIEFDDMHRLLNHPRSGLGRDPDILGAMFFDERRIVIDESLDPEENPSMEGRYRFTLAHEGGGHWRLHRHLFAKDPAQVSLFNEPAPPSVVCRSSQAKEPIEWQADFYASCLLMPRKLVMAAWDEMFLIASRASCNREPPSTIPSSRSRASTARSGITTAPRLTRMCWTASPVRWPSSSWSRRSRCASGWKSSACSIARCRFSAFLPAADRSFF
ncbi:ImmA/IrrE family metallo-endopeptidase [Bradyrhizobium barranii subsp. barranii]|uniref:ImmA/IrrE family metallo-endopeptidase n=1 Tax=Bradyrhizobium barranii subsp. barranii TaxID=2823807 RepID=A0A9X9Y9I1_9BRAD|nr:ImmA/IrrE family metallo-endopeptidase [Bradyrhizobium barranii]UEM16575.1 ImmA/IrrE family metallo-endopeptidase [Bradyrhizobium barranii subsp. barranii]